MIAKRKTVSEEAAAKHAADVALAGQFDDLLAEARADEDALRSAQADGSSLAELHLLGKRLDGSPDRGHAGRVRGRARRDRAAWL